MFKAKPKEKTVKALILHDCFVQGTPVFAGETHEFEKSTFDLLEELGRAIEEKDATKEHRDQIKRFNSRFDTPKTAAVAA